MKLIIKEQYFHHHAKPIVNEYSDIKDTIESKIFNIEYDFSFIERRRKDEIYQGINSKELNDKLKFRLDQLGIKREVHQHDGVFYYEKNNINGFDFGFLDDKLNIGNLHDYCFGERRLDSKKADRIWTQFIKNAKNNHTDINTIKREIFKGSDFDLFNSYQLGQNLNIKKTKPIVLGELQFGNWALAYRDLFKFLHATNNASVDFYVYIASTGRLNRMLSDGIVSYLDTRDILNRFEKEIAVPIWLIGIDLEL